MKIRDYLYYLFVFPPYGMYFVNSRAFLLISSVVGFATILHFSINKGRLVIARPPLSFCFIHFYFAWNIVVTLIFDNTLSILALRTSIVILAIHLYVNATPYSQIGRIGTFRDYLFIVVIFNYVMQLCIPSGFNTDRGGWQKVFLIGNGNSYVFYYLLCIAVEAAYLTLQGKKVGIRTYVLILIELLSFCSNGQIVSETGFLCTVLGVVLMFISNTEIFGSLIKLAGKHFLLVAVLAGLLFGIMVYTNRINTVLTLLRIGEGDIVNFQSRVYIWKNALKAILESPIVGHGVVDGNFAVSLTGKLRTAHNNYFQVLYYSGIVGLVLFFASTMLVLSEARGGSTDVLYRQVFSCFLIYSVCFLVEQSPFCCDFFVFMTLAVSFRNIENFPIECLKKL